MTGGISVHAARFGTVMKKYILSPLCSAFVVPGLGQILNQDLKKGLSLLTVVFVLLVIATVKLFSMLNSLLSETDILKQDYGTVLEKLRDADFSFLWILFILFIGIWIYSVFDAFWFGIKRERNLLKEHVDQTPLSKREDVRINKGI